MTVNERRDRIKAIIAEFANLEISEIKDDSTMHDDIGLDSLDIVEVVMSVEKEFNIVVDDADIERAATVSQFIDTMVKDME